MTNMRRRLTVETSTQDTSVNFTAGRFTRRSFLKRAGGTVGTAVIGGAGVSLLSACADEADEAEAPTNGAANDAAVLRIGVWLPSTGPFVSLGDDARNGIELALSEAGSEVGGRPVELRHVDEGTEPGPAVSRMRGLVSGADGVDAIIGFVNSAVAVATLDEIVEAEVPTIIVTSQARELTGSRRSPYVFRVSGTTIQSEQGFGQWMYDNIGTSMITLGSDFTPSRENVEAITREFEDAGGEVLDAVWPAAGSEDFVPFLTEVRRQQPEVTYNWFAGADAIRYVQQYAQLGLADEGIVPCGVSSITDENILPEQGQAAEGLYLGRSWVSTLDNPANQDFVGAYEDAYGTLPSQFSYRAYVGARAFVEAGEAVEGDVDMLDDFQSAMHALNFQDPDGHEFSMDPETNNKVLHVRAVQVQEDDGGDLELQVVEELGEATDPGDDVEPLDPA